MSLARMTSKRRAMWQRARLWQGRKGKTVAGWYQHWKRGCPKCMDAVARNRAIERRNRLGFFTA